MYSSNSLSRRFTKASHDFIHPANSLTTGCALTTGLMLVEFNEPSYCLNDISLLIHDNQSCGPQTSLSSHESVKVHWNIVTYAVTEEKKKVLLILKNDSLQESLQRVRLLRITSWG